MPSLARAWIGLVALAGLCLHPQVLIGQDGGAQDAAIDLVAHRLQGSDRVTLDGKLDEPFWDAAVAITDFTQRDPVEGGTPSERTEIRVAFDQDRLYIGAILYDDPAGILAFQKRRDAFLSTDDRFIWILDTFGDGRTGYYFETNAAGLLGDALISGGGGGGGGPGGGGGGPGGGGGGGRAWDGIWEVKTFIRDDGWSLEIEIPFRTLNFDPNADSWGINFQRTIRRKNEEIIWRGFRRNQDLRRPVHAGRLVGLEGITQGVGLEATPYVVTNWKHIPEDAEPTTYPSDIGIDVSYNLTPSLRAGLSVNTDFAEAEVDNRRINLTRFPQRFPELRDFFIEGSGVFEFAPSNGVEPYFSRRIGLIEGEQVPIDYAGRIGGQAGRYELGLIHVSTGGLRSALESDVFFPGEQFTAARVKRSIFEQSTIGAIYTRRATGSSSEAGVGPDPLDRHSVGVDANLFTSRLFGDKNVQAEAFYVWNSNPDSDVTRSTGDLSARGFRLSYPNDVWSGHLSYRELGDAYDPDMGFVTRNGFRRVEPRLAWSPRPATPWIRRLQFSAQFRNLSNLETGVLEEREWEFRVLGLNFESQDNLEFDVRRVFEFLDEPFEIEDDIFIQEGGYANWEWTAQARSASRRRVSGRVEFGNGGFWNGDRTVVEAGLDFRPNPGLSVGVDVEHNDVRLPQGDFTANLYRVNGGWDIDPLASVTLSLQYDDDSQVVGLFTRTRWIVRPGNEVFFVFTQNWQNLGSGLFDRDRELTTLSQGASVKVNYTVRF